jgi:hypothetical protein
MADEGKLCKLSAGDWAIAWPGLEPVGIPAGEIFLLEVPGKGMLRARMECDRPRLHRRRGLRVARRPACRVFDARERFAKPVAE